MICHSLYAQHSLTAASRRPVALKRRPDSVTTRSRGQKRYDEIAEITVRLIAIYHNPISLGRMPNHLFLCYFLGGEHASWNCTNAAVREPYYCTVSERHGELLLLARCLQNLLSYMAQRMLTTGTLQV